jgi:hypothetical protein
VSFQDGAVVVLPWIVLAGSRFTRVPERSTRLLLHLNGVGGPNNRETLGGDASRSNKSARLEDISGNVRRR